MSAGLVIAALFAGLMVLILLETHDAEDLAVGLLSVRLLVSTPWLGCVGGDWGVAAGRVAPSLRLLLLGHAAEQGHVPVVDTRRTTVAGEVDGKKTAKVGLT